jgi:hypothetical protein
MWVLRRVIVLVLYALFVAFAFEPSLPAALAVPRAEFKVISGADDRIIPPRTPVTPTPASPANTPATPASAGQPRGSLAGLRRQCITPAILLAGALLLLIVALVTVIIDRHKRPR